MHHPPKLPPARPRRFRSAPGFTLAAATTTALAALSLGAASAQNTPANHVQLRYFAPSPGLSGLTLDAGFAWRTPEFGVQLRVPELSAAVQQLTVSGTWRSLYAFGSVNADAERRTHTLTAVVGYAAPEPGLLGDATLTLVRAADADETRGYALGSIALDAGGRLSPDWRWHAGASLDETSVNAAPEDADRVRALTLGAEGRVGEVELKARAKVGQGDRAPGETRWNAAVEAAAPLSPAERLEASVELDRAAGDRERLAVTTTRLAPVTLTGALTRDANTYGLRVGAAYAEGERLSLSGEYGVALGTAVTHDAALALEWRAEPWTASLGLAADLTPTGSPEGGPQGSVSAQGRVQYRLDAWEVAAQGNARFAPGQKDPWSFHADLNARTKVEAFSFVLSARLDSATASRPLGGEVALQTLYDLSPNLALNATARLRTGVGGPGAQIGAGLRYAF